jgi:hypothetical protein
MIYLFWVDYQELQRVLAVAAEVGLLVSRSFESIDARLRRVVFDPAYIKSRLKVLCPRGINKWQIYAKNESVA